MAYNSSRQTTKVMPYSVGNKIYGGGRSFPTMGPVDKMGYAVRDKVHEARRDAVLRRLKAVQKGNNMSADAMRGV